LAAPLFTTGHYNDIPRGALLLVSDTPMEPEGIKTAASDREIKRRYTDLHLDIGIAVMSRLLESEEDVSHLRY